MSTLVHKGCGGTVSAGLNIPLYALSLAINGDEICPGAVQVASSAKGAKATAPVEWFCIKCGKKMADHWDEVLVKCPVCADTHPVEECSYTSYTPFAGTACITDYLKKHGESFPADLKLISLLPALKRSVVSI